MGFKDAPQPSDPLATSGLDAAFNRLDQFTPLGNIRFNPPTLPAGTSTASLPNVPLDQIGQASATIELPAAVQNILNTQTGITQQALNQAFAAQNVLVASRSPL